MYSLDLNPVENLWIIIKRHVYKGIKQFLSKNELWEIISTVCEAFTLEEIMNLMSFLYIYIYADQKQMETISTNNISLLLCYLTKLVILFVCPSFEYIIVLFAQCHSFIFLLSLQIDLFDM